ncbi:hypothetical protein EN749_12175 [Mesorhizobium sp. M7A.F.Ca.ET.027.02.1.1]|uniref:hypothetical protein n=1 Tax=Mesorhizobium sp. M7A.F.Ca.ET.027.02.1.1 TaxID=2496655 RepID=UPI000FD488B3|nr:hypothetical protein [Mesorhizobium sp. M7A.F.Ca.ET.027.02.1.1]RVD16501.1 hypothetical protein EN749_12175 [Mesorhizobium sp. M7A.F.Ca.ET.027.02.1.1]
MAEVQKSTVAAGRWRSAPRIVNKRVHTGLSGGIQIRKNGRKRHCQCLAMRLMECVALHPPSLFNGSLMAAAVPGRTFGPTHPALW